MRAYLIAFTCFFTLHLFSGCKQQKPLKVSCEHGLKMAAATGSIGLFCLNADRKSCSAEKIRQARIALENAILECDDNRKSYPACEVFINRWLACLASNLKDCEPQRRGMELCHNRKRLDDPIK